MQMLTLCKPLSLLKICGGKETMYMDVLELLKATMVPAIN
ncbi:hypothetical protein D299_gp002 [Escherichia phage HX01]|nr:hypothetical protein D299_gp002 [Escherichia phage HX01]